MLLRLWLPGYHTPSLNRTKGHHWSRYRKLKQHAAGVLLSGLQSAAPMRLPAAARRFAFARLVEIAHGGKVMHQLGTTITFRAPNPKPQTLTLVFLRYTRVTCQPLDAENFAGSTKALTDCLVSAFPAWLPDDSPEHVKFEHVQVQCAAKCEQGTWVEVENASDQATASGKHGNKNR